MCGYVQMTRVIGGWIIEVLKKGIMLQKRTSCIRRRKEMQANRLKLAAIATVGMAKGQMMDGLLKTFSSLKRRFVYSLPMQNQMSVRW